MSQHLVKFKIWGLKYYLVKRGDNCGSDRSEEEIIAVETMMMMLMMIIKENF